MEGTSTLETVSWPHDLYGGWPALDFANTLDARAMAEHEENLFGYADLLRWSVFAGTIPAPDAADLRKRAARDPAAARAVHTTALTLREAIYRTFAARANGAEPAAADLAMLVSSCAAAVENARLERRDDGRYAWSWAGAELDRAWWPLAQSAVELATHGPVDRVKICASDEGCAGLFVDASKNRSRRWCTMESCGVDSKIRRQNARRRIARKPD